jgi:2-polyprenyl-6-methoxyphenol hydroxylase-like FAD-dependent oxidoreductase
MTTAIVVVGSGLVGLATSLGLAKLGYNQVELVECRKDWARQGSAFGLAPNGIQALQELCPKAKDKLLMQGVYFVKPIEVFSLAGGWDGMISSNK